MPSGPKKRKAAKRKNQKMAVEIRQDETPGDPNPNSGFLTPMQTPPHQVNGRDQREDDGDERFETPRFQPEALRMPATPYYSMENVKSGRRGGEIAAFRDVNALIDGRFKGLDAEIPSKDEERLKEMKLEESSTIPFDEGLKEVKLDEFLHSTEEESSKPEEEMLEKLENLDKIVPVDEEMIPNDSVEAVDVLSSNEKEAKTQASKVRESSKAEDAMLEKLENLDKFANVDEERIPNGSVEAVDILSLDEKEVKSEALTSELILADCGEMDGDDEDHFESEGFTKFRRNMTSELSRDKPILAVNGDLINDDDVLFDEEQEVHLDKGKDGEFDLITENYNDEVDLVPGKLPQVDLDLTINKLEKFVEKSSIPVENSAFNAEEPHQEYAAVSHVKKIEAAPRKEVARGAVVARHATLWNCCGLLEVFMSSDK